MASVFPIVEDHGDVAAVPILLRRIAAELLDGRILLCLPAFRLPRTKLTKSDELSRALEIGRGKLQQAEKPGFILIVMDYEGECPIQLVEQLQLDHKQRFEMVPTSVVFAVREFESWFLAADMNEHHHRSLQSAPAIVPSPESVNDAKGAFRHGVMKPGGSYSETVDQPKYAACMDLAKAQSRSSSFGKLVREIHSHLGPK